MDYVAEMVPLGGVTKAMRWGIAARAQNDRERRKLLKNKLSFGAVTSTKLRYVLLSTYKSLMNRWSHSPSDGASYGATES